MAVTASIARNDGPEAGRNDNDSPEAGRVQLTLIKEDGRYVWQAQGDGEDAYLTDVQGATEDEAIRAAQSAFSGVWDLQFDGADRC